MYLFLIIELKKVDKNKMIFPNYFFLHSSILILNKKSMKAARIKGYSYEEVKTVTNADGKVTNTEITKEVSRIIFQ